jgi:LysR family transcriptional regulator, regulator for bpeEF and oprC
LAATGEALDKLRAITFFCRTVEAKSFAAAAQALVVTPSGLSKLIGALEQDLKFTLFNRSTRRLSLTAEGAAYYERCKQVLQDLEEAELTAVQGRAQPKGTLRVGLHPALRLAALRGMRGFLNANPDLRVETVTTNAAAMLLSDGLDVMLRIGEMADSGLVARHLGWAEFVVCASPTYLREWGKPMQPQDLARHQAVIYAMPDEEPSTQWEFTKGDARCAVTVPIRLIIRDGVGGIDAAVNGCGILRPFGIAVEDAVGAGQLELLLPGWSSGRVAVFAVFPKSRAVPAKVHAFVEFANQMLSSSATDALDRRGCRSQDSPRQ